MAQKLNGSGKDDKIIKLPTLAERDRMRKAKKTLAKTAFDKSQKPAPFLNLSKIPPFTRAVIAAFIAVHVVLYVSIRSLPALYDMWNVFGFVPAAFTMRGFSWEAPASVFTHMFIHGSWMHLFVNTTMALVMGMAFEKNYGAKTAAFFFFACGIAGALLYFVLQPFSDAPVIGGSAALCGWFGAMTIIFYQLRPGARVTRYGPWPIVGFWVLFFTLMGTVGDDTMAWQAHIGGFLAGVGLLLALQKGKLKFLN